MCANTLEKIYIFELIGLDLRKLPNYVQYVGFYNFEGVAESWKENKMSWVEVHACLSNF